MGGRAADTLRRASTVTTPLGRHLVSHKQVSIIAVERDSQARSISAAGSSIRSQVGNINASVRTGDDGATDREEPALVTSA